MAPAASDIPLGPGAFALGPPGARTVVDISVDPVPAAGLTLCLPASPALLEAAAGRPLTLLRYADGEWAGIPGSALDADASLVCAAVTAFSPFAAGYPAPPGAPTDLTVGGATGTSLEAGWTAPADTGARLTGYGLQYRPAGTETWTDHAHAGTAAAATLVGLTPNTDYEVRVRALGDGQSEWTAAAGRTAPLDETASRFHLFPLFAHGDGFRSHLYLTNVSVPGNACALTLHGAGLNAARFGEHPALSGAGFRHRDIALGDTGAAVALTAAGGEYLAFGYAKLACTDPAAARMLLVRESGGGPAAMTNLESAKATRAFRFPALPRLGRLGLVLANDNEEEAACAVEVASADGTGIGGGDIAVPARSAAVRFLDELVPMEEDAAAAAARITCDRPVAPLGVALHGGDLAALAAIDLEAAGPADDPEDAGASRFHRLLPLVQDGGGFRSSLLVTNLSEASNACTMRFALPGVPSAKFQSAAGVTWADSRTAALEMAGPGSLISLASLDRSIFVSFGHAALECEGPADLRNLLTVRAPDGPAGVASIAPVQSAREMRFPVPPRLESLALVLTNAEEAEASCEATLTLTGREETLAAEEPIQVGGESTAVRFLADLFELPEDFTGGEAALLCGREIMALSLPAAPGAAFTAMPPAIP